MNLTGKDLKAYREYNKSSQRVFARAFNFNRNTLANYEWSGKELPSWICSKMITYDPNFVAVCLDIRETERLKKKIADEEQNVSWLARFVGWLMRV